MRRLAGSRTRTPASGTLATLSRLQGRFWQKYPVRLLEGPLRLGLAATASTIRKIFHPFEIKMLAMPGVAVLQCDPYRQIPIVIHGFLPEASSLLFYPNCPEQFAHPRARARGCVSL